MEDLRLEKYAKLLAIFDRSGRVHSRIKAQKILYILKSLGFAVAERYEYRNYGPYSEELASELKSSVNADFLREDKTEREEEWTDETLVYERYDYSVTPKGKEFLRAFLERNPEIRPNLDSMAVVAAELNRLSPKELELIATLMFLQDQPVRPNLIFPMLQSLKPQFTQKEVDAAMAVVEKLRTLYAPKS